MYARDILSRPVVTVRMETPLPQAVSLLTEGGFAALPVVDEAGHVVGVLSESDALSATRSDSTVEALMTTPAEVVEPGTDVPTVAARMLARKLRSMPVVEAGVLVGIVARRDLLRTLMRDDAVVEAKIRALLDDYAGSRRQWTIRVEDGRAVIAGGFVDAAEQDTVIALALTVDEITHAETAPAPGPVADRPDPPLSEWLRHKADETIG
ncbi:CBS domain-containing protein [Nocardia nova SH22a]|uniref:CBS domain-containing protein n=1 Tax=Nocardia nova SH22a TaxID=1415166 RepID=W5TH47_9NOCA|nr:CBS domain-containing protein [Nocardia nova]AHH18313.1 CBS domain-containing protein [Nocardia nova SH22a]